MNKIPEQYLERLDQKKYQEYQELQTQINNIKAELENLYQYLAELNYDSKNNDSAYHNLQKQLHEVIRNADNYTEDELDMHLKTIASEQQIIRTKNDEILNLHQEKLKDINLWEIKRENAMDELKIKLEELKASIK